MFIEVATCIGEALTVQTSLKNDLLRNLTPEARERLHLCPVDLPGRREIESPGQPIHNLFFLESGVASMTASFSNGREVEIGIAGREGVLGYSALLGTKRSLNSVYMQIAGAGHSCLLEDAHREFHRGERFQELVMRYSQAQFLQTAQTAGCNTHHSIEQRLARWLLLCLDRSDSRTINLSQEFVAEMLGVVRTTVAGAAAGLRDEGLIEYRRARIEILDARGLERKACECYQVVRDHLNNYAEYDSGFLEDYPSRAS